jgi:hypothetical protein
VGEFDILESAAAGMDAQRFALDLAARNVAAAQADPNVFARLVPRYAVAPDAAGTDPGDYEPPEDGAGDRVGSAGAPIRYLGATEQRGVEVDAITEMVSVLDAQRAYEADASVFDLGKHLAERTIDLGRLQ